MIEPYNAVGLIPTFWGVRSREDIQKNIDHIEQLSQAALNQSKPKPGGIT